MLLEMKIDVFDKLNNCQVDDLFQIPLKHKTHNKRIFTLFGMEQTWNPYPEGIVEVKLLFLCLERICCKNGLIAIFDKRRNPTWVFIEQNRDEQVLDVLRSTVSEFHAFQFD